MSISNAIKRLFAGSARPEAPAASDANEIVYIKNYFDRLEAEMAKSFLEGQGITSIVSAADRGGTGGMMGTVTGGVRLLVQRSDVERATALLESEGAVALPDGDDVTDAVSS